MNTIITHHCAARASRFSFSGTNTPSDGSHHKKLSLLARTDPLILDDFGLKPLQQQERRDLPELIEDRHGLRSTLIRSQLPISGWLEYLNDLVDDFRNDLPLFSRLNQTMRPENNRPTINYQLSTTNSQLRGKRARIL